MVLFVNMIIYFPICHLYRSGNAGSVCCFLVPLLLAPFFEALPLSCPTLPYFRPAVPTLQLQTDNRSIQLYRYGIQPRTPLLCTILDKYCLILAICIINCSACSCNSLRCFPLKIPFVPAISFSTLASCCSL